MVTQRSRSRRWLQKTKRDLVKRRTQREQTTREKLTHERQETKPNELRRSPLGSVRSSDVRAESEESSLGSKVAVAGVREERRVSELEGRSDASNRTHFDPPPQARSPESPIREAPMRKTTTPVTIGGKIFLSFAGGTKDMPISRREQSIAVG